MNRVLAILILALISAPVALAATSHHSKSRCTNRQYAKKHRRQCKRKKKAQQIAPVPTTTSDTPAPPPNTPISQYPNTPTTPPPTTAPPATRLGVVAREFSLILSRSTITSGNASVQLQNFGEDPHNLRVERVDASGTPTDFPLTQPQTQQAETVTLGPGTYKLYCTLPGHDAAGMHATLTVTR